MHRLAVILHVAVCLTVLVTPTSNSSSSARNECQPHQFTCTSGACIDNISVCNSTAECRDGSDETENACKEKFMTQRDCLLPQQPEFGSYTSLACENGNTTCRQVPGTPVREYWLLTFKCNDGYYMEGAVEDKVLLLCVNGKWSEKIPVCLSLCGRMNSEQQNSLLNVSGSSMSESPAPWVAVIYSNTRDGNWNYWCLGTLISPHTVLTSADCVYAYRESPHKFRVAVGKRFTYWNSDEPGTVKAEVREIAVHPGYSGRDTYFVYDVVLIDLKTSVAINSHITPACVDWGRDLVMTPGQLGTINFSWKNGNLSALRIAYKDTELCRDEFIPAFRHRLLPDKLCFEFNDENGDDLLFENVVFERNGVHYVKGVVSTLYTSPDGQKRLLLAVNLGDKDVLEWLQRTKRAFDEVHNGT